MAKKEKNPEDKKGIKGKDDNEIGEKEINKKDSSGEDLDKNKNNEIKEKKDEEMVDKKDDLLEKEAGEKDKEKTNNPNKEDKKIKEKEDGDKGNKEIKEKKVDKKDSVEDKNNSGKDLDKNNDNKIIKNIEEVENSEKKSGDKGNKEFKKKDSVDDKETTKSDDKEDKKEISSEESIKHQNKILRNFLILIGGIILVIIMIYFIAMMQKTTTYKGVEFNEHQEKDLLFYHTTFPIINSQGDTKNFNVYLRTNPDKLKTIEFNGDFEFKNNMVINFSNNISQEFECEGEKRGDDVIAIANVLNVLSNMGTKVIRDQEASCDSDGRYIFMNIKKGNTTKLEEYSENCYDIYVKDCEVLHGTERFILEALAELKNK